MLKKLIGGSCGILLGIGLLSGSAMAAADCSNLPNNADLTTQLKAAQSAAGGNGGFGLQMWGTVVNRAGEVCAVAFTGTLVGDQWPGSRVISAQKANTANAFGLPGLALSTANLFSAVQPGGSLFGLQESNPVNTALAYAGAGNANQGTSTDPMINGKIGGVNVFGGGLALYAKVGGQRLLVGAIGVSGDSSCADHNIAWRTRANLALDYVPSAVSVSGDSSRPDNIVYDIATHPFQMDGVSASGWGHPICSAAAVTIAGALPTVRVP